MQQLDTLDKKFSRQIHHYDNKLLTAWLYPFSLVFQPQLIFIPASAVLYLSRRSFYDVACYIAGVLAVLLATTILKYALGRIRPEFLKHLSKPESFRKKQRNCSLPSGDTAQSMFFVVFLYLCFGVDFWLLAFFHFMVAFSRVYFMCHWIGDTVFGSLMAYPIAIWIANLRNQHHTLIGLGLDKLVLGWFGY